MSKITPLVLASLKRKVTEIPDDMPTFRGAPIIEFDKPNLVDVCRLFANEMHKYQKKYFDVLRRIF